MTYSIHPRMQSQACHKYKKYVNTQHLQNGGEM